MDMIYAPLKQLILENFSSFVVLMALQLTRWASFVVLVKFTKPPVKRFYLNHYVYDHWFPSPVINPYMSRRNITESRLD